MDAKSRWSGTLSSGKKDGELIWEARRRFQASKRVSSGVALAAADRGWQGAVEDETAAECLLEGPMVKQPRGQSNSFIKGTAKNRYFKLFSDQLRYYQQDKSGMTQKGTVNTKSITVIEELSDDIFGKNSFQVVTTEGDKKKSQAALYVTAPSTRERDAWMFELRLLCYVKGNTMQAHYHPDILHSDHWKCCKNSSKILGCRVTYNYPPFATYEQDVVESVVEPIKLEPPSSPVAPLSDLEDTDENKLSVDCSKEPVATLVDLDATGQNHLFPVDSSKERSVSLSELAEQVPEERKVSDDSDRLRSETFAVSPSAFADRSRKNNPFMESLKNRPPKPGRKRNSTPFDKVTGLPSMQTSSDSDSQVSTSRSSTLGTSTDKSPVHTGTSTADPVKPAVSNGPVENPPDAAGAETTADTTVAVEDKPPLWQPVWPGTEQQSSDAMDIDVSTAGQEAVDGPSSPPPVTDDPILKSTTSNGTTTTTHGSDVTATAPDISNDVTATTHDVTNDVPTTVHDVTITSSESQPATETTGNGVQADDHPTSPASPFGDDNFGSLNLPQVEGLRVKSVSALSLTPASSDSDAVRLPAPPSPARARRVSEPVSTGARPTELDSISSTSSDFVVHVVSPGLMPYSSSEASSTTSPVHVPPPTVSKPTPPDLMNFDLQDESTSASLLTTSSNSMSSGQRSRSSSAIGKLINIRKPKEDNRTSTISRRSVAGSEVFDIVEPTDCHPEDSQLRRERAHNFDDFNPFLALHQACQQGLVEEVTQQLEDGINPDEPHRESRQPPLFLAYFHDHVEVIEVLLAHGAQVNMTLRGPTLLHVACESNNMTVINILLKYKAKVDLLDWQKRTPLHLACQAGHAEAASILIEHGAQVNAVDQDGNTPLHMCCCRGHTAVVELLLDSSAEAFTKNKADLSPLDLAVKDGYKEVTELLRGMLPDTERTYICQHTFRAHRKDISTVNFLPDHSILSGASDNRVCVWDSHDVKAVFSRKFSNNILSSAVHQSAERSLLAIGSDMVQVLDLWQAGWGVALLNEPHVSDEDEQLYLVEFSPTGLLATAGVVSGTEVLLWNLFETQTGLLRKPQATIVANQSGPAVIHNIQFSPRTDNPVLAVSVQPGRDRLNAEGNNTIHLFDWTSACHLRQIDTGHKEAACDLSITFSTHGRYIVTGSGTGKVSVWTTRSGLLLNQHEPRQDEAVRSVAVSSDGHTLATASESGHVDLYNIATGKVSFLPEQYEQRPAVALSFSNDGQALAAGYDDGTVQIWNVVGGDGKMRSIEVEAFSPYEYSRVVQANGSMSPATRAFLATEFENLDVSKSGSLDCTELDGYFTTYLNTSITPDMFLELQQHFLTDADLGGLTVEGFSSMAFQHLCLDPDTMWPIWISQGFSVPVDD